MAILVVTFMAVRVLEVGCCCCNGGINGDLHGGISGSVHGSEGVGGVGRMMLL